MSEIFEKLGSAEKKAAERRRAHEGAPAPGFPHSARPANNRHPWMFIVSIAALLLGVAAVIGAISLLIHPLGGERPAERVSQAARNSRELAGTSERNTSRVSTGADAAIVGEQPQPNYLLGSGDDSPSVSESGAEEEVASDEKADSSVSKQVTEPGKVEPAPKQGEASRNLSFEFSGSGEDMTSVPSASKPARNNTKGQISIREVPRAGDSFDLERKRRAECLAHLSEAQRLVDRGEMNLAASEFEKALSEEPENLLVLMAYGKFQLNMGKPNLAERYLRMGVAADEGTPRMKGELHADLGLALYQQGLLDDAVKEFQTALSLDDGNTGAYNNLAVAFKALGKRELAMRIYNRLLLIHTQSPEAYYGIGLLEDEDGNVDAAIFNYSRFLIFARDRYVQTQEQVRARVVELKKAKESKKKRKLRSPRKYVP